MVSDGCAAACALWVLGNVGIRSKDLEGVVLTACAELAFQY